MTYAYGDTSNPLYHFHYEAERAAILNEMIDCRYCKASRTRAIGRNPNHHAIIGCEHHRYSLSLAFVTSPVSDHYWQS